ncbi:MAG: hypothetical protein QF701_06885 [Nitrospinota bacterium]|jgi:nitrogen fixation-related uncharacterized protein|nr:hypothetical protein [Nitrospinota bacterium]MDP6277357.1 hypothetical protein [Nitrospinota bacterium]MDP7167468.1 hypothetical protein [Nitrospinota bacterium]MDP7503935.1 hypothetical protein [Nitrospinota bacterium]MDP7662858.1 hypothetical protein [Nitrospinota bacterium]|tara:strand:- start:475 stop:852 length:378 start_codon:yes stop_codon:yes gene_type:complete
MSGEKETGVGLKWPICTMLIVAAISALIYYGYTKFEAEQAIMAERAASSAPAHRPSVGESLQPSGETALRPGAGQAYRGGLSFYLLVGFAVVMTAILGGILYLWWSLKDWEGGKKYGEEDTPTEE